MPEQDVKNPQDLKILLMFPINSLAEYKLPTQPSKQQKHYFTHGTTDEDSLKQKLFKRMLENLSIESDVCQPTETPRKRQRIENSLHYQEEENQEDQSMSPLTLRKFFLRKRGGEKNLPPPHPAAAAAAKAAQATAPHTHQGPERKTECFATSNRSNLVVLTRFKKGFEEDTEKEVAAAFHRPPRTYKEDTPFYPWLPPAPKVNFKLNFKF